MTKSERAKKLRYKKPALDSIGWEELQYELYEIEEACAEVHWSIDQGEDSLLAAMDGEVDDVYEFKMAFAEVEAKCEQLRAAIEEQWDVDEYYDDCTVALIGNRYNAVGYDDFEEDYFALASFERDLAFTESGKRVMRWTKAEMLSKIGQCMGIAFAFIDLRQSYDYLQATMDILRDENMSILKIVKEIEQAYEKCDDLFADNREFDRLLSCLPDRVWIE